ncbi:MAG: LPS biosynthesis protein [Bdellovibrionales bacterium RIFOXYC1_FULL_54_43]|nr:MAG: LPS biosynthesis protein [Bdellovibrionales bacterium RIFOXYC1_FULL_54_43]OFZ83950.1 MAG: LPS biosynthesis protein [Bdellovibrionales bacterium RIFOXYD1_FULL_55_31]
MTKPRYGTYYNLPAEVKWCTRCVMSNQRPASTVEFAHKADSKKVTLRMDEEGVCDACRQAEVKQKIDWKAREQELIKLCDKYRKNDGSYDCICPGSGGKDSAFAAHLLKYKYGMNPLTVTWPPILYTDYGYQNFRNWLDSGFDNISFYRNGKTMKLLTKCSIENLLHPFQTFILGQKSIGARAAVLYNIPLVFYGENEAEYGNPIAENTTSLRNQAYHTYQNLDELHFGGVSVKELREKYGVDRKELSGFLPASPEDIARVGVEVHYLGYYVKWVPQEVYYYAVENTGFKARPFRTQGTYSKYNSIDDKIDDLHYYTTYIKFGIGRATYDSSQEIRNKHITREEGMALVKRFDGEFPDRYFKEIMDYLGITPERFMELCDRHRSPHLWANVNGEWKLRHTVNKTGVDD